MLDTNLKNNDDLEMKNAGNENVTNGNVVKKNHNWKILGIIAMILTVFIAAGATVGLYPYMEEKAAEFNSRNRRQETEAAGGFGNLTTQVMNFSYVLWHQQKQEENGGILTYSQTFLQEMGPGLFWIRQMRRMCRKHRTRTIQQPVQMPQKIQMQ